ncbi:MAG: hypothetical protein KDA89_03850 [Planctomycetaceae bacterium]|nr:hypothetical protein [Planctomycetaceae bacterium]
MDAVPNIPSTDDDLRADHNGFLERSIVSVLELLARCARTVRWMLFGPRGFARGVCRDDGMFAPPHSFLLVGLLLGGIGVRLGVAFFEQRVDHTVLSRLAETVRSVSLEDIFVLTVPAIILVALTGVGVARWTTPETDLKRNPVVRTVCFSAGLQFAIIGTTCVLGIVLKALIGRSALLPGNLFDQTVLTALLLLVMLSTPPLYHTIRRAGTTRLSASRPGTAVLSVTVSAFVLLSVAVTNAVSFDLSTTIAEVRLRHQHRILSNVYVAARTLSSRMIHRDSGQVAMEMNVALVNVSEIPVLVPQPFELENAHAPNLAPLQVLAGPSQEDSEGGWMLQPGETRVIRWTLSVPDWCSDPETQQSTLPVTFACFPFHGTEDLLNTHPIGTEQLVYAQLTWPMSDAWKDLDRNRIHQIARMISESRTVR